MLYDLRQIYHSADLIPILQQGFRIPSEYQETEADECPTVAGREVDELMTLAADQGFLSLPWGASRMDLESVGLPQRLFNTYCRHCRRNDLPVVVAELTGDGRGVVGYDVRHLPLKVDYPPLLWQAELANGLLGSAGEAELLWQPLPNGEKPGDPLAGENLGRFTFLLHDPVPLALVLHYASRRVEEPEMGWMTYPLPPYTDRPIAQAN